MKVSMMLLGLAACTTAGAAITYHLFRQRRTARLKAAFERRFKEDGFPRNKEQVFAYFEAGTTLREEDEYKLAQQETAIDHAREIVEAWTRARKALALFNDPTCDVEVARWVLGDALRHALQVVGWPVCLADIRVALAEWKGQQA